MKIGKLKALGLVLAIVACCTLISTNHVVKAAKNKGGGIVYVTKRDVKNGKVEIRNRNVKGIVVKKDVKKAIIYLSNVKISGALTFEKGNYNLNTIDTSLKNIKITQKNTNVKLYMFSDLNDRNFSVNVSENATGSFELPWYNKKATVSLGDNSDFNINIGDMRTAEITVKNSNKTAKLEISGDKSGSKISKITVDSPVDLSVRIDVSTLITTENAKGASVVTYGDVDKVKNDGDIEVKQGNLFKMGETWTVDGQWSLTINSVEETTDRNPYSDKKPAAVYIVNYTYTNLGYTNSSGILDGLYIGLDIEGNIVDNAKMMGYSYPGDVTKYAQETPVGATCNAQICVGVDNKGSFQIIMSKYDGNGNKQKAIFDMN